MPNPPDPRKWAYFCEKTNKLIWVGKYKVILLIFAGVITSVPLATSIGNINELPH